MKKVKKLVSFMLAAIMVLAMAIPAMAAEVKVKVTLPDEALLDGHTFTAYQIFTGTQTEAEDDNKLASVEWASEIDSSAFLEGLQKLDADAFGSCKTAADVADALSKITDQTKLEKVAQLAYDTKTGDGRALTNQVTELPAGYYVIIDTTENIGEDGVRNAALLAATKDVTVQLKTDKPSLDKSITVDSSDVKYSNGAIGDVVNFKLTSKVPDMSHYVDYKFVVDDVMSKGLIFNNDVQVTIGDDNVTDAVEVTTPALGTDVGAEYAEGTAIHMVFKDFFESYSDRAGQVIEITYSGTIGTDAVIGVVGNPNEARLQYSNNPNEVGEGDDFNGTEPSGKTPWSETRTYVTAVELLKTDENGNALAGAQFKITGTKLNTTLVTGIEYVQSETGTYWQLRDSEGNISYTDVDPNTQGLSQAAKDKYVDSKVKYEKKEIERKVIEKKDVNATAEVGADGILRIEGLAEGNDYVITEIMAPNGYNLLANPIILTITCTYPDGTTTDTACTWAGTFDLQDGKGAQDLTFKSDIGAMSFSVKNMQGSLLPSTGGIGTTIFYVLGGILVLGAGVLLIVKKRMSKLQ